MDRQFVLIGEILLENNPRIALYAKVELPLSKGGIATLEEKLSFLLGGRFRAADPAERTPFMSIFEIAEKWHCETGSIARMARDGRLHPIIISDEPWFDRVEVARVMGGH